MTKEEKEEIINLAVERAMLILPETVGHLITNHMTMVKMNEEFYKENPDFIKHKDIVSAVMETVEGENTLIDYKSLLDKAIPKIRERIATMQKLDTSSVDPRPNRDFNSFGEL